MDESKVTYLPECEWPVALKHWPEEIVKGKYWEPFVSWDDPDDHPKVGWMTAKKED